MDYTKAIDQGWRKLLCLQLIGKESKQWLNSVKETIASLHSLIQEAMVECDNEVLTSRSFVKVVDEANYLFKCFNFYVPFVEEKIILHKDTV